MSEYGTLQPAARRITLIEPVVNFEAVTFSDGSVISLEDTDVVVFVGPNNAGKSLVLRELEAHLSDSPNGIVATSAVIRKKGSRDEFESFCNTHLKIDRNQGNLRYRGYKVDIGVSTGQSIAQFWPNSINPLSQFFCLRMSTESRITDSNPAHAIDTLHEAPSHPIHMLYTDDDIEFQLSDYFQRAFGQDLILYRAGGRHFQLLVGERTEPEPPEDRVSSAYCQRLLASTVPLIEQGDGMRSFASVVLHLLAPLTPSILILDEPEAFLHPPQARLLGEIIATERSQRAQLFVATHSADVLRGLIDAASDRLHILRMHRDEDVNVISELDKDYVREISTDPLMRHSAVLSSVFHERVLLCESDADCMFYGAILELSDVHGTRQPDALFVHANGKHRLAALAGTVRALGVSVDVIVDMDVLDDLVVLEKIVSSLGGDWATVSDLARRVKVSIEQRRPPLNAGQVKDAISGLLDAVPNSGDVPVNLRSNINAVFRRASQWDAIKSSSITAIPAGQTTKDFQELQASFAEFGLWTVPVGEMEGFCRSIGGHGPKWVQRILEERVLATDAELDDARAFIREIWSSRV